MSFPAVPEFDHVVLVTADVEQALDSYHRVLGAAIRDDGEWRSGCAKYLVLHLGTWKINVHLDDTTVAPVARVAEPGTLDICFNWHGTVEDGIAHLEANRVAIEAGPVEREGARGRGQSVYFRDPDGDRLEFICYEGVASPPEPRPAPFGSLPPRTIHPSGGRGRALHGGGASQAPLLTAASG